jgi:hypothetical protein
MIEPDINEQLGSLAPSQGNADLLQNVVSQESLSMTEAITPRRSFVLPTAPPQPQLDPALKAVVDEMANQRSAVLNSSLYNATKKNPDTVAEAQRVGKQMGVGADIAERNLAELQRGAMMLKALDRNLAISAPKTANSLTEPDFANIAYDDLENLTGTEKLMNWFAGTDFFKGAQGTFISTEMATIDQLNSEGMATSKDFERYKELQRDLQIVGQPAPYSISGNIANLLASVEAGAETGAQYAVTGAVLGGAAGAIGGPLAPATMPAGMALGAAAGFSTGMAKWMYQSMAGESYRQLREGDVSHEVALPMSRGIGVITSALEFAGLGAELYIASGVGKKIFAKELATDVTAELSKQMIKKATASEAVWDASKLYFGEILTESTVEGLQTAITRVGTEIGRAYDRPDLQNMFQTPEGRRAIISEAVDSFVNVAIGMSVAGLPLPAANYYMDRGRYADAKRSQQFYEDLSKNAVDSKMRQRNPDAAERFYADQVDGTGAETTYVDGRVMQNILNQSGLTNEQVDTVLPGIRQQLAEAISIGGDVTIPTATYAARLAGTKLGDSMKIHMRPNADAWSADTAVKYAGQLEQEKEKALALLEEKETTDTAFVNEARVIEKDMQEKLTAVGRDPKLAKVEATIFRDMMVVAAAEAKMTPAAYMAQHGPNVVGPQTQVAPLEQAEQFDQAGNRKTTTPEWNKWFGKSKVVDKANKPIVLYRGEDEKYLSPKIMFSGGIFLTTDKSLAKNYGPYVMEVFASIDKPLDVSGAKTITLAQWKNYFKKQGVDVSKLKFDSSLGKRYGDYGVDTLAGGSDQEFGVIRYNFYELLGENDSWFGDGNLRQELQRQGFDGVKSQPESNLQEGENRSDVWIVWEGNQLKDVNNLRPSKGRESIYEQAAVPAPSTGVFDARNPPVSSEPIFAVMNADGQIYYDVNATMHGDLVETFPDIADTTIDGGFIINGKYKMGMSDGGYSAFEGTSEQVEQVKEFTKQANTVPQVLEQAAKAEPGANSPGVGVGDEPKLGFWKPFRVKVVGDAEIPAKKLILTGTKNNNADKQLVNVDGILAKFPAAGESIEEWTKMMAYALGSDEVPIPPYAFIKGINGDGSFNTLSKLTEGQISDANHGFENAAELRAAYTSGELSVTTTAKLILWSFLSRGVSPYRQESLFIDAFDKSAEWIGMAAEGKFSEEDFPAYDKWARSAAPKGSGLPGAGATHNLNAFGKDFLFKMSKIGDNGKSHLQNLHDMLSDPNQTGQSIRREFAKIGEGVGIDNKVMSFTLLVAGFDDVMVLDRVQIRQLWDDGRFPGVNLYDGTMNEQGKKISGSSMNDITEGVRGILVYEALERQLQLKIYDLYERLGRPQDASVGRYHWETWVAFSQQEASHGTLAAVLADAKGDDQAIANVASKEGEYGAYEYGAMYNRNAAGVPWFQYQTPSGNSYSFTVPAFREFLANIKQPKNGVVPTQFKVTESANAPWYTRPEVNQQRLDEQAAKWADLAGGTGEGKRIVDEIVREQNANRARSTTDAVAIASKWEVPALPDGSSTLERKFYAGESATKFARLNREQGIFDTHFSYEQQTVADTEGLYRLGVPIVGEYVAGVGLAELYKRSGNATPTFYELGNTAAASERFHAAIVENKQASPFGATVAVYTPKEYRGMRLFLSADAKSGVAVKPDGDIVSVFAANNSGRALIELAVSAGGTKLDAFDTVLAHFYAPHGFVVASRMAWNEEFKPEGWDKQTFSAFNNGKPDVVFMARDDAYMGSYKSTDGKLVTEYDNAVKAQSEAINVINKQLFQAAPSPGPARGGYDPKRIEILLNSEADAFTFLHELMHWRMDKMIQSVNNGTGSPREIADLDIMVQSFKLGGENQQERLAIWNAMTFEEQRPHWEAIAYNFENYLFEGKAPSVEMQGVFDRMASFIKRVYVSIRDDLNKIYRREFGKDLPVLTDEVRGVMDRMLASEDQIKRKQAMMQMVPMFLTQEEATEQGMDDVTYAAYQAMNKEAEDAAVTDLTKASLKQMQWLSGARSRVLKELQAKHDALRKEIRAEVKAEVDAEPIYAAMSILKTGEGRTKNGELVKFDDKFKLNLESVKKMIPAEDVAKLGFGKYGMVAADGMDPDMAADMFGFSSGDELVLALLSAKPAKEEINARTDKRMMDENGDMNTPQSQEEAVQRALHNEARFRFNAVEVRWLSKATSPVRVFMDAAKLAAQQIIAGKVIRDLRPSEYQAAEAKAAREAADAHSKRRTAAQAAQAAATKERNAGLSGVAAGVPMSEVEAAAAAKGQEAAQKATERESERKARYGERTPEQVILRAKQIQLLQNQLAREAQDAKDEVSKGVKYLRNVLKAKNVQRMGADIADQVTNMLERFSLANISVEEAGKRLSLAKWIEGQLELGIVPDIDPKLLDESFRKPYQQMTVSEFRDLVSSIQQLEYIGKHENEIRLAGEKVQFVDARDAIVKSIQEKKKEGKKLNPRTATTKGGRALEGIRTFMAAHLKVAAIARIMDGGKDNGKVWNYFIRSANAAGDMETRMIGEATEKVMNILKPVKALGNMESGRVYFKSIDRSLNRGERFVIALNSGNEGNLQRMRDGEGWTMEQLAPVLESLSSTEWNAVQAIWNHFETYKPLVEAKERRLYGKGPNWIEVKPFAIKTSDGKTLNLEGGYYPIKYDPKASDAAEQFTDAETAKAQMKGAFTAATTRRSYVKNRAERVVGRPLMLTMTGVYSGLGEVIHDLCWHEWLISANRMMKDREFSSTVNETYGPEIKRQMKDWIKDVAAGQGAADQGAANFATWMRRSISSARLGFNATSGVMQISGLANTWVRIDGTLVPKWTAIGVGSFVFHPKKMMSMIQEKSSMMRDLGRTQFRDLNEIRNTMQDKDGKWNAIHANAYIFCKVMQSMVNYPTWAGAYEKALFEGNNEDTSIALADQAVIDSQGGGQLKDLASVERGGAWSKLFTVFYGYQNALFNSMATSVMTQKKSTAAAQLTLLVAVPAVYKYYVNQAIKAKRKDNDDDEEKGLAAFVAEESIQTMLSSMVGIRELSNLAKFDAKEVRDYSGPSGLAMMTDIYNVTIQARQNEWDAAYRRALLNLAGDLFGIPAVQINRTVDGIQLMIDKNNADLRAPIFGTRR